MNQLEPLEQYTTVVSETGNVLESAPFAPHDASTSPWLILRAEPQPGHAPLLAEVVATQRGAPPQAVVDAVPVRFGRKTLHVLGGRVSTGFDARLPLATDITKLDPSIKGLHS